MSPESSSTGRNNRNNSDQGASGNHVRSDDTQHKTSPMDLLGFPSCPLWLESCEMPRKKKLKKFTATKVVKSMARTAIGAPRPVQREESSRRSRKQKHKTTLGKLLEEGD